MATAAGIQAVGASTDIASLLAPEDIPVKLRCAVCSKLAVNAVKLPCCDQSICETCHSKLPASCPVCEHTPISAEDCKPNKSLRTTIRVYLRTAEKKREIAKGNAQNEKPPPESTSLSVPDRQEQHGRVSSLTGMQDAETEKKAKPQAMTDSTPKEKEVEKPDVQSIQTIESEQDRNENVVRQSESLDQNGVSGGPQNQVSGVPAVGDASAGEQNLQPGLVAGGGEEMNVGMGIGQYQQFNTGTVGADAMQAGYPNMNWNAQTGFNPMMQNVQNPMANGQWNMYPNMMNMPAMNMNPMSPSQGMFGGLDGRGNMGVNGMNGMNMNMNMGMGMGISPNVGGHGGYGGWNGQTGWNAGQEKFNPMGNGGNSMGVNFGAGSAAAGYGGYHHPANATTAAGYNYQSTNGNYSQMPQSQLYHQNHNFQTGFHGGGLGHGYPPRGPRPGWNNRQFNNTQSAFAGGRGYGQGYSGDKEPFHQQLPSQLQQTAMEESIQKMENRSDSGLDEPTEAKAVAGGDLETETPSNGVDVDAVPDHLREARLSHDQESAENANDATTAAHEVGAAITSVTESVENNDRMMNEQGGAIASKAHPVDKKDMESVMSTAKVINAPLGPAAQAARGRGWPRGVPRGPAGRGGRGAVNMWQNGRGMVSPPGPAAARTDISGAVLVEPRGRGVEGAPTAPKAMRRGNGISILGRGGNSATATEIGGHVANTTANARSLDHLTVVFPTTLILIGMGIALEPDPKKTATARRDMSDEVDIPGGMITRKRIERDDARGHVRALWIGVDQDPILSHLQQGGARIGLGARRSIEMVRTSADRIGRDRSENRAGIDDSGPDDLVHHRLAGQQETVKKRHMPSDVRLTYVVQHYQVQRVLGEEAVGIGWTSTENVTGRDIPGENEAKKQRDKKKARDRDEGRDSRARMTKAPTAADYHTLEREARNRERLLADQRKRQWVADDDDDTGVAGADVADDNNDTATAVGGAPEGRGSKRRRRQRRGSSRRRASNTRSGGEKLAAVLLGGRKMSVKYEGDESDEARATRIEKEREAQRWE
ncbi:MAG: hypothetical protein M1816_004280 [Peltula sp. TS41687]|nr:MAG: hypothetical protein M1816_004280 [Peltula sp. TS41687]